MARRHAYAVVDVNGRICWGLVYGTKREASEVARHPKRKVILVEAVRVVRKSPKRRKP